MPFLACLDTVVIPANINYVCNLLFSIAGPQPLSLEDLYDVYGELYGIRSNWYQLGYLLKVNTVSLDAIKSQYRAEPSGCLREMLVQWLRQVNTPHCWKAIVDALHSPVMAEVALADLIEKKHCPGMFTMIEVL